MEKDFFEGPLLVDYSKTIEEAVAAGHYRRVESLINSENFLVDPKKLGKKEKLTFKLFEGSAKEVVNDMEKQGFYPGGIMELAAFGFQYPRLQRRYSIVALDSSGQGVPCLRTRGSDREIVLVSFESKKPTWEIFVFLGIKN